MLRLGLCLLPGDVFIVRFSLVTIRALAKVLCLLPFCVFPLFCGYLSLSAEKKSFKEEEMELVQEIGSVGF